MENGPQNAPTSPKVLIVDDVPSNIEVLEQAIGDEYELLFATNGPDALTIAGVEQPDLILLDVMMPEMDGYQVCRRLKDDERTRQIPVVFVTAMNDEADEARGLRYGAIDYITKPISVPILQARVRNHLELKKRGDLLEKLAMMDGLTAIPNRRRFDEALDREWRRALRTGHPLSLILMDVDYFKKFNDYYGHSAGDLCLKDVAFALTRALTRPGDLVARYGGEEFVCLLPETAGEGLEHAAQRMREAVIALEIPHEKSDVAECVTLSLGGTTLVPTDADAPVMLIQRADDNLYTAKQAGRNRYDLGEVE